MHAPARRRALRAWGDFPHVGLIRDGLTAGGDGGEFPRVMATDCVDHAKDLLTGLGWRCADGHASGLSAGEEVVVPWQDADDIGAAHVETQRRVGSGGHAWGIATAGNLLHIVGRYALGGRPCYLEIDVGLMTTGWRPSDAVLVQHLLAPERFCDGRDDSLSALREDGPSRIRERLERQRQALESALGRLLDGLTVHPTNELLRAALAAGQISPAQLAGECADCVLAMVVAGYLAERGLIELLDGGASEPAVMRLAQGDIPRSWGEWCAISAALARASTLGGDQSSSLRSFLASSDAINVLDLDLDGTTFDEIRGLTGLDPAVRAPLSDLRIEEIGSLHEALLASTTSRESPSREEDDPSSDRNATGAFFTPARLVDEVLHRSLDPLLEDMVSKGSGGDLRGRLLALTICDPACGSGNFLLGAAYRITHYLQRQGLASPSEDWARAAADLAEVIDRSIYGADMSLRAVAIARISLWAATDGRSVSPRAMARHFACGDALNGATIADLEAGLPEEALAVSDGDDPAVASTWLADHAELAPDPNSLFGTSDAFSAADFWEAAERVRTSRATNSDLMELHRVRDLSALWADAVLTPRLPGIESPVRAFYSALASRHVDARIARRTVSWEAQFPERIARGESGLFDVVVGNPPYARGRTHAQADSRGRLLLSTRWTACQGGQWNLYVPFVLLAASLARRRSVLLVQSSILGSQYAAQLHQELRAKYGIAASLDFSAVPGLFPGAAVQVAALVVDRQPTPTTHFIRYASGLRVDRDVLVSTEDLDRLPPGYWTLPTSDLDPVEVELFLNPPWRLADVSRIQDGMEQDAAYAVRPVLREATGAGDEVRLLPTGLIDPYRSLWGTREVKYLGKRFQRPVASLEELQLRGFPKMAEQARAEKIAIAGLSTRIETVVDEGTCLVSKSAFVIRLTDPEVCPYAVSAVLNSRLADRLYEAAYAAGGFGAGSKNYRPATLGGLPLPEASFLRRSSGAGWDSLSSAGRAMHGDLLGLSLDQALDLVEALVLGAFGLSSVPNTT